MTWGDLERELGTVVRELPQLDEEVEAILNAVAWILAEGHRTCEDWLDEHVRSSLDVGDLGQAASLGVEVVVESWVARAVAPVVERVRALRTGGFRVEHDAEGLAIEGLVWDHDDVGEIDVEEMMST